MLGLPVLGTEGFATGRRALAESVMDTHDSARAVCCMWDRRLHAATVRDKCTTSDLWEAVGSGLTDAAATAADLCEGGLPRPLPPELDAAIALQDCLDEEMGGWPNTFG